MKKAIDVPANWLAALLLGALTLGCVPEFDDDVSQVEGFRVLAVRADPAEVEPGDPVRLSVLWATPEGEAVEEEDILWGFCNQRKELTEAGPVSPDCIAEFGDPDSEVIDYLGNGASTEGTIERDVCRYFGPLAPPPEPGQTTAGRPVDPDVTGGFYQPVLAGEEEPALGGVRLLCGTPWLSQSELVRFNQGYRPNEHPALASLSWESEEDSGELGDGDTLAIDSGAEVRFRATWTGCPREAECGDGLCTMGENATVCSEDCGSEPVGCTGAEDYLLADVETRTALPKRENVSVAWFANSGAFESSVTDDPEGEDFTENSWTAPDEAGTHTLWLVLRDDRGGVSWRQVPVLVR
jgi:hypothetical protein